MNFSIGERVKFLNTKGGGVIRKIIDTRMVSVETEGGFEIPTLVSELVRIDERDPGARFFSGQQIPKADHRNEEPAREQETDERSSDLPSTAVKTRNTQDIYLAFFPHDQKWLISGLVDIYIVNNTSFDILYNLFLEDLNSGFTGKDYGSCFSGSRLLIATITREELPQWSSGYIQFLFHTQKCRDVLPPFNSQFRINGQKFYQETSYRETNYFDGKIFLLKIVSVTESLNRLKPKEAKESRKSWSSADENVILKHMKGQREAEVDLHIHELVDDPGMVEGSEALPYQKEYFVRCLESAIANHVLKLTVIHGIGGGVLRENLLEILKQYQGLEVQDAPMQKYGVGAIEIRIPHNFITE